MTVTCAWCGVPMGTKPGPDGTSHGICPECVVREEAAADVPTCAYCGVEIQLPPATWLPREGAGPLPVCAKCAFVPLEDRPAPKGGAR